ncbi:hypothetical protein FRC17_004457 [Serendipita sp. 399]|nr:hypothetical protein FRC17_004457 [Serendipita sp. 399]
MGDSVDLATSVPLPMSTVGSPETYSTPLPSPQMAAGAGSSRWFAARSLHASPTNSPLPAATRNLNQPDFVPRTPLLPLTANSIEIVPPTPPELARTIEFGEQDDAPTLPYPTPRSVVSNLSVEGDGGGKRRRSRTSRLMMDRMSRSFHTGTPPPAIVRLRDPDDEYYTRGSGVFARRPLSNVYVRGGGGSAGGSGTNSKRSSIVSLQPDAQSKRHSVASLIRQFERGGGRRSKKEPTYESAPPPPKQSLPPTRPIPPLPEGEEGDNGGTPPRGTRTRKSSKHLDVPTSDDTHVATAATAGGGGSSGGPSSSSGSTEALSMSMVDPLTVLERRRRRDFTIGSHNPLHGPPNTPAMLSKRRLSGNNNRLGGVLDVDNRGGFKDGGEGEVEEDDEEDMQEFDHFGYLAAKVMRIWTRIGDMPWVADPCVATLVIPHQTTSANNTNDNNHSTGPTPWYRPKPSLDELLSSREGEGEDGGAIVHDDNNDNGDALNPHEHPLRRRGLRQRQLSDATSIENDGTSAETIVTPTTPTMGGRKKGVWHPRMPEPIMQRMGRERFGDALVIRGLRRMSS